MRLIATLLLALAVVSAATAMTMKPRASITTAGKTRTYAGGKCIRVLNGFRLTIGKLKGPRYFSIQYVRPLINGLHFGAVVGAHFGGKYYASPNAAITLRKHGKTGTFSGTWDKLSGSGPFRGTYTC